MKSHVEPRFWKAYDRLPPNVRRQADAAYELWQQNPYHPSLQFKCVDPEESIYSVRIGRGYRALGWFEGSVIVWFWIGDHDEYIRLIH
jgi:mRNA-degrading endonuclease RelE of RelBE toxin-antitoxin system